MSLRVTFPGKCRGLLSTSCRDTRKVEFRKLIIVRRIEPPSIHPVELGEVPSGSVSNNGDSTLTADSAQSPCNQLGSADLC
jgi:hypothetical protein